MKRQRTGRKLLAAALACLVAACALPLAAQGAVTQTGNIRNDDHTGNPYPDYQMNKTLTYEDGNYLLELTAGGHTSSVPEPIYVVLVLDATSSMGAKDVDSSGSGASRWQVVSDAAKSYLDELFKDTAHEKNVAVVSFGYGARVHLSADSGMGYPSGDARTKSPDGSIAQVADNYIGGYRAGDDDIHALGSQEALTQYRNHTAGGTDALFYSDQSTLSTMIDNISQYSGTNNESGLLLANDLLGRAGPQNAHRYIIFISDGESPATSSFATLYEAPFGGMNLSNVYDRSQDGVYVASLYATLNYSVLTGNVNPFDGNWHNIETASHGSRLITLAGMAGKAQSLLGLVDDSDALFEGRDLSYINTVTGDGSDGISQDYEQAAAFLGDVHRMLVYLEAYDAAADCYVSSAAVSGTDAAFWNKAVRSVFWQGGDLTKEYNGLYTASDFSGMPNAPDKHWKTMMLDYREYSNTTNVYGSTSATFFTVKATNMVMEGNSFASYVPVDQRIPVYAIAVGMDVKDPGTVEKVATTDYNTQLASHFYVCHYGSDDSNPNLVARDLLCQKMRLIAQQELLPRRNVTIRDTLAADFSVDTGNLGTLGLVTRWYYDGNSPDTPQVDPSLPTSTIQVLDRQVTANVGTLYDEATAKHLAASTAAESGLDSDTRYYFKAAIRFPILVNMDTIAKDAWVKTNASADYTWDDGKSPQYVSPEILFESPSVPVPVPEVTPTPSPSASPPVSPSATPTPTTTPGGTHTPGGTDPEIPPIPYIPGNELVPGDDGSYIEIDENGVPLGEWHWEPPVEEWIFEEYPPLTSLPTTGTAALMLPIAAGLMIVAVAALLYGSTKRYRLKHKEY